MTETKNKSFTQMRRDRLTLIVDFVRTSDKPVLFGDILKLLDFEVSGAKVRQYLRELKEAGTIKYDWYEDEITFNGGESKSD